MITFLGLFGAITCITLMIFFVVLTAYGIFQGEVDAVLPFGLITLVLLLFTMVIPVKYTYSIPIKTERAIVGSQVIFVVDNVVKSYNDIQTMKNIDGVRFRISTPHNIYGYELSPDVERTDK